jgi:hypothetical protein
VGGIAYELDNSIKILQDFGRQEPWGLNNKMEYKKDSFNT